MEYHHLSLLLGAVLCDREGEGTVCNCIGTIMEETEVAQLLLRAAEAASMHASRMLPLSERQTTSTCSTQHNWRTIHVCVCVCVRVCVCVCVCAY